MKNISRFVGENLSFLSTLYVPFEVWIVFKIIDKNESLEQIEYHVFVDTEYQAGVRYRQLEKLYRDCLKSCKIVAKVNFFYNSRYRLNSNGTYIVKKNS